MQGGRSLFLIGPMGAGKTTIGRSLSERLNLSFYDSDRVITERAGADIPWIFDLEGEQGFRDRESVVIDELTQLPGIVLATGGGAVLREENRTCLRSRGLVVYLETSVKQQLIRTAKDKNRPLLQKPDRRKILEDLLKEREPLYRQTADLVVSTDQQSPKKIIRIIAEFMESHA